MTPDDKTHLLLRSVATSSAVFEAARAALHDVVHAAVGHGASWAEIGGVLGVSRQAAFQRFGSKGGRRDEVGTSDP